jgi:hypothetical protein
MDDIITFTDSYEILSTWDDNIVSTDPYEDPYETLKKTLLLLISMRFLNIGILWKRIKFLLKNRYNQKN